MASIKCGKCHGTHHSVQEVKWCHNVEVPESAQAAFGLDTVRSHAPLAEKIISKKEPVPEGFYKMDDKIYKVVKSQQGRSYAKVLTLFFDGPTPAMADIATKGVWEYMPGMMSKLTVDMALTKDEAAEFGQLYGICAICGAVLTNEESIERGIGPICFGKMGW